MEQIYPQQWIQVKPETREKLREIFSIPRSTCVEVITNEMGVGMVMCDGTTLADLQHLTAEKMRDFIGTAAIDETLNDLFNKCIKKIETPTNADIVQPLSTTKQEIASSEVLKDNTNVNKCPDCEYVHASKQGLRMHIYAKHTRKK